MAGVALDVRAALDLGDDGRAAGAAMEEEYRPLT
jgi:hypothetical protein